MPRQILNMTSLDPTPLPPSLQAQAAPVPPRVPIDWKTPYRAAINEHDSKKKRDLCDQACRAINDRILEQGPYAADEQERGILEEGLRQLTLHKQKRKRKFSRDWLSPT